MESRASQSSVSMIHSSFVRLAIRKMSFETSVSRLPSHVKDLVFSVSKNGGELLGNDEADKQEVIGWIEKTSQGALVTENNLKVCNNATMETSFKSFIYRTSILFLCLGPTSQQTTLLQQM